MNMPGMPEWSRKPELDVDHPAKLFLYAKKKQRWLRRIKSDRGQLAEEVDYLVDELERYVTHTFDSMPELDIISPDVHKTLDISGEGSHHRIENGPAPLKGDAALLGEHAIRATFYRFHRGDNQDLRVYVSSEQEERHFMGGIYVPLLSVGIDTSTITLSEYRHEEQLDSLTAFIIERLDEFDDKTASLVRDFVKKLKDNQAPAIQKLNNVSPILAAIAQYDTTPPQYIDALLDAVYLKLELDVPHDIQVSSHRVVLSDQLVAAYKSRSGPTIFRDVVPQLGLIGETGNKGLGLFFMDDESAVQIPVQYITRMNISQS